MPEIRCHQIGEADIPAIAALLARGFPKRGLQFWQRALDRLSGHEPPAGLPKYGYFLETNGRPVGALLMICSSLRQGGQTAVRCNLSSWYVDPAYRTYGSLLVSQAVRDKTVTYLNVSAAPHTWPIIEAQGFSRYCDGIFVAIPALQDIFGGPDVKIRAATDQPAVAFDPADQEILLRHIGLGCISLWCETADRAYPFVFRPRRVKGVVPCAQMIYCRDVADFVRFAGPIGRYLAWRGKPFVIIDSNGAISGLFGMFFRGSMTKYFKGPQRPRLGDLAYTEYAVLGV